MTGAATTSLGASPEELARLARTLGEKLERLAADTDPERLRLLQSAVERPGKPTQTAGCGASSRAAMQRVFLEQIGGLPALASFLNPAARLALMQREHIHGRLCALALACRPGALRGCVDKATRKALQTMVGDAWEPLCSLSRRGGAASPTRAQRSPMDWASVGYADWREALLPRASVLHRLVGLSFPEGSLAAPVEPADLPAPDAVREMAVEGLSWPC